MQVSSLQGTRPRFTWKTTPAGEGEGAHRLPAVSAPGRRPGSGRRAAQGARTPGTGQAGHPAESKGPDTDTTVSREVS